MNYKEIEEISTSVIDNELIRTDNLTLVYELTEKEHYTLDNELFRLFSKGNFTHKQVIDLNLNGVTFKFIKKDDKIIVE